MLTLVIGFGVYGVYQLVHDIPVADEATRVSPSPSPSPSVSLPPSRIPTQKPATEKAVGEIYQRSPRIGIYYAENELLNDSNRQIAGSGSRFCIKVVDGPSAPNSGYEQILVSSLSSRSDGIYIDATQEKLKFDRTYLELTDRRGVWQRLEPKVDTSGLLDECLAAQGPFVRQEQGQYVNNGS